MVASSEQLEWVLGDDTGLSSKTIFAVMTGTELRGGVFGPEIPHDPSDLGRCLRLLARFPEWKPRLQEVADKYPRWQPFVREWRALADLYYQEMATGRAPKCYEAMAACLNESYAIARAAVPA